ncbi:transglutaminase domain-containing protein [Cryomorpha ignava]|uniref:Transglutaminase domain-containing protein n=1 Tax=Cryomorpha ignava TaxID=101383 RepID=A0A7K3WMX9_9FLAO|nr:transglutaminase domain-containing protein [Cryomorpha ignava]NEN22232.1 transglutaminase domain-containing protein [Cryomorpha ignava]
MKESFTSSAEPYMPESDRPIVYIVPEIFEYGNIIGSFSSWQDYGVWMNQLWEGRSVLSKSSVDAINKLIVDNLDREDLAKAIYKYTQQNMRYVSISLGLGGLQTMSAKETAKMGYGDCKALSNFTAAAMNHAGIEAYPALIYGGSRSLKVDP